jgi:hypothetical protein
MVVRHAPGSAADAFDVNVNARVDPYLDIIDISAGSLPTASATIAPDKHSALWVVDSFWLVDAVYTVVITARIRDDVPPAYQNIQAFLSVTYDSNPGTTYDLAGRPVTISEISSLTTPIDVVTFGMTSVTSIDSTIPPEVSIEEVVTYTLSTYVPEGTSFIRIQVDFDGSDRMEIASASFTLGSSFTCTNGVAQTGANSVISLQSTPLSSVNDQLVIDFGACTNAFDNVVTSGDTIVTTVVVSVRDNALLNRNRNILLTSATLECNNLTAVNVVTHTQSALFPIVEPFIHAEKVVVDSNRPCDAGDVVGSLRVCIVIAC